MREIKFRAWNSIVMVYQDYPKGGLTAGEILKRFDNVMQFTGLLDKNGKEIYEGDILRNDFAENLIKRGYFLKAGIPPKVIFIINDIRNLPFWEGQEKDSIEVIGNIYENLELLSKP